jgi:hypothetical protein
MLAETITGWQFFAVIAYVLCGAALAYGIATVEPPRQVAHWMGFLLVVILWPLLLVFGLIGLTGRAIAKAMVDDRHSARSPERTNST